jgi:hypothetical protein
MADLPKMELDVADTIAMAVEAVADGRFPVFGLHLTVRNSSGQEVDVLMVTASGEAAEEIRSRYLTGQNWWTRPDPGQT